MKCVQILAVEPFVPEHKRNYPLLDNVCVLVGAWNERKISRLRFDANTGKLVFNSPIDPTSFYEMPVIPPTNDMGNYEVKFGYGGIWDEAYDSPHKDFTAGAISHTGCYVLNAGLVYFRHKPTGQEIVVDAGRAQYGPGCSCGQIP